MTGADPIAVCADAAAGWHAAWLTSLGLRWERSDSLWWAVDSPPFIYWAAITLAPDAPESLLCRMHGTICDSWSVLELSRCGFDERDRDGFEERAQEPWFLRPAGALPDEGRPSGLEVVRASTPAQVAEFEDVSVRGFGGDDASVPTGTFHPAAILADERITMLIGRVDGNAVAAAMGYRTDRAVGIYGVTTIASARRRGYASALTRALIDPTVPAVLSPSPEGESLYRQLGFEHVGELRQWHRP